MKPLIFTLLFSFLSLPHVYSDGTFEIRLGITDHVKGWVKHHHEGEDIWISPDPVITSEMISSAEYKWVEPLLSKEEIEAIKKIDPNVRLSSNATESYIEIEITLTEEGAKKQSAVTEDSAGSLMVFMFEGKILTAPRIMEKISGDVAVITGKFTEERAKMITNVLNQK